MKSEKKSKTEEFNVEIGLDDTMQSRQVNAKEREVLFKSHVAQRSPQRKIKTEMLSIQYQIEEYIDCDDVKPESIFTLEHYLLAYLKVLNLNFKLFAEVIDTTDSNLKKYLKGERKFNTELAMKFGHFFHTTPDLWLRLHLKNEFVQLKAAQQDEDKYSKYDYEKQLQLQ